ncbi:MAG: hypothetical protein MHPSP_004480, partial [Paramarteilia canceri]
LKVELENNQISIQFTDHIEDFSKFADLFFEEAYVMTEELNTSDLSQVKIQKDAIHQKLMLAVTAYQVLKELSNSDYNNVNTKIKAVYATIKELDESI